MKCKNCPFRVDNSNESNRYDHYCFVNDKEAYEFRNGGYGCDLTKKEVSEAHKRLENIVEREVVKFLSNFSGKGEIINDGRRKEKIDC